MQILYRGTLKNWPEGASSIRDHPPTDTLEKHWGGAGFPVPPGSDAYELLKTPSHRLVRSQYCEIVWVKKEGSWRDLEICASPKVGGGSGDLLPPPSLESGGGGASAPSPPFLRPCFFQVEPIDKVKVKTLRSQCWCTTHWPLTLRLLDPLYLELTSFTLENKP